METMQEATLLISGSAYKYVTVILKNTTSVKQFRKQLKNIIPLMKSRVVQVTPVNVLRDPRPKDTGEPSHWAWNILAEIRKGLSTVAGSPGEAVHY